MGLWIEIQAEVIFIQQSLQGMTTIFNLKFNSDFFLAVAFYNDYVYFSH